MNRIRYFTPDEVRRIFDSLKGKHRDLLIFKLLYRYGLRVGELIQMKVSDFKPDNQNPIEVEIRRLKNNVTRHYPVSSEDAKILRKWLKKRKKGSDWLFPGFSKVGHITKICAQKLNERITTSIGLPREKCTSIHMWRHTCCVHLLLNQADIKQVQFWLSHSSLSSTEVYSNIAPEHWVEASRNTLDRFTL
jgi:integrase